MDNKPVGNSVEIARENPEEVVRAEELLAISDPSVVQDPKASLVQEPLGTAQQILLSRAASQLADD